MTMNLKQLQQNFKNHIFNQESPIVQHIVSDQLSSEFRLGIYADAYAARLIEVLQSDFPVLHTLLGEEAFMELSLVYINQYPSTYTSLRWFGRHMPKLLKEVEPYCSKPYLAQMARFEWSLVDAFNASDQPAISENDVARIPPDKWPILSFGFHPSVHSFQYQWNVLPIWQAHKENNLLPSPDKLLQAQTCLVWRQDLKTLFRTLAPDEAQMFTAAREGANFSDLCEQLSTVIEDAEQVPLRAVTLLKTWISQELITDINY
jgi:hypothetical protein